MLNEKAYQKKCDELDKVEEEKERKIFERITS